MYTPKMSGLNDVFKPYSYQGEQEELHRDANQYSVNELIAHGYMSPTPWKLVCTAWEDNPDGHKLIMALNNEVRFVDLNDHVKAKLSMWESNWAENMAIELILESH